MQWYKVKSALIWVFLVLNLFLVWILYSNLKQERSYEKEALDSTLDLLAKNGIIVNCDLPSPISFMPGLSLSNPASASSDAINGVYNFDTGVSPQPTDIELVKQLLTKRDIDVSNATFEQVAPYIRVTNANEKYQLFDCELMVGVADNELCYLKGVWQNYTRNGTNLPVLALHQALMNYLREAEQGAIIVDISYGYSALVADGSFAQADAHVVCRIRTADNKQYLYVTP